MTAAQQHSNYGSVVPQEVTSAADLRRIAEFRTEAWMLDGLVRPEQLVDGVFPIEEDAQCRHWIIEEQGRIVAAGRLSVYQALADNFGARHWKNFIQDVPLPFGYLSRLVVHPKARRHGLARVMDECRISAARRLGLPAILGVPLMGREVKMAELGFVSVATEEPDDECPPYDACPNGLPVMMLLL